MRVELAQLSRREGGEDEQRADDFDDVEKMHGVVRTVFARPGTERYSSGVRRGSATASDHSRFRAPGMVGFLTAWVVDLNRTSTLKMTLCRCC
ncbi:hypothetical protein GCM10009687_21960 [Asanoa iriomotensis]|uniref:Uncharacterized protein n=1 Tax=Asanoa iriomotensis TaxID=234613 RepID=A0ABQ4CAV8_9ACTN|nr:hypothetical protein Air01nite_60120 [Asanoa iriomotensis]